MPWTDKWLTDGCNTSLKTPRQGITASKLIIWARTRQPALAPTRRLPTLPVTSLTQKSNGHAFELKAGTACSSLTGHWWRAQFVRGLYLIAGNETFTRPVRRLRP